MTTLHLSRLTPSMRLALINAVHLLDDDRWMVPPLHNNHRAVLDGLERRGLVEWGVTTTHHRAMVLTPMGVDARAELRKRR